MSTTVSCLMDCEVIPDLQIDISTFKEQILSYNKKMKAIENEKENEKKLLVEEICHLKNCIEVCEQKILSFTEKIQTLIANYSSFAPILELKDELNEEVSKLKKQLAATDEKRKEEINTLQDEVQQSKDAWSAVQACKENEHQQQLKCAISDGLKKAEEEKEKLESLREIHLQMKKEHLNMMEEIRRKHHEELEKVRGELIRLQKDQSSSNFANLDTFANKLQSVKEDYEISLNEKKDQITDLQAKLKVAEDNVRHMRLLSVIRNVQRKSHPSPATGDERQEILLDGESSHIDVDVTRQNDNEHFNPAPSSRQKRTEKRKLFSGKSFLE